MAAAGALIASTSAPVIFVPGVLIGLGLLFFGIGEWINHPIQMRRTGGVIAESYPWRFSFFGVLLDMIGMGFFGFGVFRLLAFGP
jgi:hypothetical protein